MREVLRRLFPLGHYSDPIQRRQAIGTYSGGVLLAAAAFVFMVVALTVSWSGKTDTQQFVVLVGGGVLFLGALGALFSTARGQQVRGAVVILVAWVFLIAVAALSQVIMPQTYFAAALFGISLSTALVGEQALFPAAGASAALLLIVVANRAESISDPLITLVVIFLPVLAMHTAVNYLLARNPRGMVQAAESESHQQQERIAAVSNDITQRLLASRLAPDNLYLEIIRLLKDFSGAEHVQLYLVDTDRKNATLVATSSNVPIGQRVGIGSLSTIGRVTISGQPVVVREAEASQGHRRSAFLPGTRAELALPLRVGTEIIGALDLQSQQVDAFANGDIETYATLANQIAIAVDNARLYAETQERLNENQRLFEQTRTHLREIERLNQQLIGGAWAEYLRGAPGTPAYTVDRVTGQVEDAAEWTPTLADASRRNQVLVRQAGQVKFVSLPISVRGQVIGAMEFEIAPEQDVSGEQVTILQQVVERLGLAAENARLLEEAQRLAQREALVNEISARLQATTNVDAVIAAATQSLADAFQAPRVAIRLGTPVEVNN
jgi:GAF domain-containing protein